MNFYICLLFYLIYLKFKHFCFDFSQIVIYLLYNNIEEVFDMAYSIDGIRGALVGLKTRSPALYVGLALSARYLGKTPVDGWRRVIRSQTMKEAALEYADPDTPLVGILELGGE